LCADQGALEYERLLTRIFGLPPKASPSFDLILLGLGSDGHTASLFPGDPAVNQTGRMVVPVLGGVPRVARLTLTLPALNAAAHKVFGVSGRKKSEAVYSVLEKQDPRLPASQVSGPCTWILDEEAAYKLAAPEEGIE